MSKENENITPNEAERIDASLESKESKIFALTKLSRWLEIDVTLKIFGVTIFQWHFPPSESSSAS